MAGYGYESRPNNVTLTPAEGYRSQDVLKETVAARMLEASYDRLNLSWVDLDKPADFEALSALPVTDKQALFAGAPPMASFSSSPRTTEQTP